ncbi:MAG: hypothetical protein OEV40_09065 [Acidimicrobiia bacterium]|nr:hypothetical protein [Acidimicrobiia bacterium]
MTKYVLTYHGGSGMPEDPAEIERLMGAWGTWFEGMGEAVVDGGNPFGDSTTVSPDGSTSSGRSIDVSGYSILNADSLEAAVDLAKGCPVLEGGGTVQVSEALEM